MNSQTEDRARLRRQLADRAIKFAMANRWEEAAQENQRIIAIHPRDADAHNRLGKALSELGRNTEARGSYSKALELDPNNAIAKKNLQRLQALGDATLPAGDGREKVDADLFIEETGKTGVTQLNQIERDVLQRLTAGDRVDLVRKGSALVVHATSGEYLGMMEPRLGLRLTRLMESGNEYAAAIASISPAGDQVRVIIKETRQSVENVGRLSFPTTGPDGVRPYTRESLFRYDADDDETDESDMETEDWEGEGEQDTGPEVSLSRFDAEDNDDRGDFEE